MKKFLIAMLILVSANAMAQHRQHPPANYGNYERHRHHGPGNWVAPLVLGSVIGYAISRPVVAPLPPTVIYQEPPVIYQEPAVVYREAPVVVDTYETVYINGWPYKKNRMFLNGQWQDVLVKM